MQGSMVLGLLVYAALVIADALFSSQFVAALGTEYEANPLMRWLMEQAGLGVFFLVKLVVLSLSLWAFAVYYQRRPRIALALVWLVAAIHVPVVIAGWHVSNHPITPAISL